MFSHHWSGIKRHRTSFTHTAVCPIRSMHESNMGPVLCWSSFCFVCSLRTKDAISLHLHQITRSKRIQDRSARNSKGMEYQLDTNYEIISDVIMFYATNAGPVVVWESKPPPTWLSYVASARSNYWCRISQVPLPLTLCPVEIWILNPSSNDFTST